MPDPKHMMDKAQAELGIFISCTCSEEGELVDIDLTSNHLAQISESA